MPTPNFRAVHPILPSQDVRRSIEYYTERLGFRLAFQDNADAPGYAGVIRDSVELHLQWHDPAEWDLACPSLRFLVADVDALFEEFKDRGVFHEQTALRDTAWGTREFAFFDPYKNGLTFYRDL